SGFLRQRFSHEGLACAWRANEKNALRRRVWPVLAQMANGRFEIADDMTEAADRAEPIASFELVDETAPLALDRRLLALPQTRVGDRLTGERGLAIHGVELGQRHTLCQVRESLGRQTLFQRCQ